MAYVLFCLEFLPSLGLHPIFLHLGVTQAYMITISIASNVHTPTWRVTDWHAAKLSHSFPPPPPIWLTPWRPAERRKWGDPQVTPRRLRGPGSSHVSISRHNDKTVPYRYLRKRGGSVGARKVEQIRNGGFCRDIWNGITQQPPKAISVSVQDKICQSAACCSSTPSGLTLILKPVCSTVAALNWV